MEAVAVILLPFAVYVSVRLGSAAWFKSKQEFDSQPRRKEHG